MGGQLEKQADQKSIDEEGGHARPEAGSHRRGRRGSGARRMGLRDTKHAHDRSRRWRAMRRRSAGAPTSAEPPIMAGSAEAALGEPEGSPPIVVGMRSFFAPSATLQITTPNPSVPSSFHTMKPRNGTQ